MNAILDHAADLDAASRQAARALNTRREAEIPEMVRQLSAERSVFIFNVGPWSHVQWLGSMGKCNIPACPTDAEYSEPVVIPGIPTEQVIMNENQMTALMYDGMEHARAIVGIGKHMAPQNSLERVGVAISTEWPPSAKDVAEARKRLLEHCRALVGEANAALAQGPKAAEETIRPDQHFVAARILGLTDVEAPFLHRAVATKDRIACPFCGESMGANLPKCPNCKEIVNKTAYKAAQEAAGRG